jgi:hypothetical protein
LRNCAVVVALASVVGTALTAVVSLIVSSNRVEAQVMRHEKVAGEWLRNHLGKEVEWDKLNKALMALGYPNGKQIDEGFRMYVALMAGFRPKSLDELETWKR